MAKLKYQVIESKEQYFEYCDMLEKLIFETALTTEVNEEIKLLRVLIEKWDIDHKDFKLLNPIELIKVLLSDNDLKQKDLANILDIGPGTVSEILSYKRGLSKDNIRKIAEHFKILQESLNRPYKLQSRFNNTLKKSSGGTVMNSPEELETH